MELHERIVKARTDAGLSQEGLAQRLGKTRSAVAKWESGDFRPRQKTLQAIADVTGKPRLWLEAGVGGDGDGLMVFGAVAAGILEGGSVSFVGYQIPLPARAGFPVESQRLFGVHCTPGNRIAKGGQFLHAVSVE